MATESAGFDYFLRIVVRAQDANASLRSVTSLLRGIGVLGNNVNNGLGKTVLRLGAVAVAAGVTLKLVTKMYEGAREFNNAIQRTQSMGMSTKVANNMTQMARSLSMSSRSIVTSAEALSDVNDMIQRFAMSPKTAGIMMPQAMQMQTAFTGLMGGDVNAAREQTANIIGLSVEMNRLRSGSVQDIQNMNDLLFKMREALGDSAFSEFASAIKDLPAPILKNLSGTGLQRLGAFSTAAGPMGSEVFDAARELRQFAVNPAKSQLANFLPQLGMFGFTDLLSTAAGKPFAMTPALRKQLESDPMGFMQNVLVPRVRGFLSKNQKGPVTDAQMISTLQRIFKGSQSLSDVSTMLLSPEFTGAAGGVMDRISNARTIANEQLFESENSLATATKNLSQAFSNLFQQMEPMFKTLIPLVNDMSIAVKGAGTAIAYISEVAQKIIDFGLSLAAAVWKLPKEIFKHVGFGTPPSKTAAPHAGTSAAPGAATHAALGSLGLGAAAIGSTKSYEEWHEMFQRRGMQNTYLAKLVRNPEPFMRFLSTVAKGADAAGLYFTPTTSSFGAGDLTQQERNMNVQDALAKHVHIHLNVHADDPHAAQRIGQMAIKHIVRAMNGGALNATGTPAGVHMASAFTGKQ